MKLLLALAIAATIATQPANAFGPAGMGRDLMYTASIARAPDEVELTRVGFVRPSIPRIVSEQRVIASGADGTSTYTHSLSIVTLVIIDVLARTALAFGTSAQLGPTR